MRKVTIDFDDNGIKIDATCVTGYEILAAAYELAIYSLSTIHLEDVKKEVLSKFVVAVINEATKEMEDGTDRIES